MTDFSTMVGRVPRAVRYALRVAFGMPSSVMAGTRPTMTGSETRHD
jgi:hypothetical protein